MAFEEAKITDEPQEVQVSSNELVFMMGESVVRDRQNLKRLQFLDKQVALAREETLKAKSLAMAAEQKNVELERVRVDLERVHTSLDVRIKKMESVMHELAVERDGYRNQLTAQENKKPKRTIKRVKHTPNPSRD